LLYRVYIVLPGTSFGEIKMFKNRDELESEVELYNQHITRLYIYTLVTLTNC